MYAIAHRTLFWTPRMLCLSFAAFLSLFALDVFDEAQGLWATAAAFLVHLIPVYVVLAVLAVAWRREWFGAVAFGALGLAMAGWFATDEGVRWDAFALIAAPPLVVAALFWGSWRWRARTPAAGPGSRPMNRRPS